ncbi:ABC transporter ATP-binding protein [Spirochaeta lutea]|uniref:ABC transporter ATP-binding protein n=1 Tax=Spirochaeta lutea TaxID=1480694 RepID=UPI00068B010D|nr:ATP-binding cassette domain-containing protein [Spirochaeta lutea]
MAVVPAMVQAENLSAGYRDAPEVFRGVNLSVHPGDCLVVLGISGCGKSTLLRTLADLHQPSSGRVVRSYKPHQMSFIPQHTSLFPWFSLEENVALPLTLQGIQKQPRIAAARQALDSVDLGDFTTRRTSQLSGGQLQRAALARALAGQAKLLLLDEPFSALDAMTRESLQDLLASLIQSRNLGCILVTHSIEEAAIMGTQIGILTPRGLEILREPVDPPQKTTPQVVSRPPRSSALEGRTSPGYFHRCRTIRTRLEELQCPEA